MDVTGDELAGVADLFGGLTRDELARALAELAYREEGEYDPDRYRPVIDGSRGSYHLVAVDPGEAGLGGSDDLDAADELLIPGPLAFPTLPSEARDLPHILDIEPRTVDPDEAGEQVADRFRAEAQRAIEADETTRIETLLDASYELEAWANLDLTATREELSAARQTS